MKRTEITPLRYVIEFSYLNYLSPSIKLNKMYFYYPKMTKYPQRALQSVPVQHPLFYNSLISTGKTAPQKPLIERKNMKKP